EVAFLVSALQKALPLTARAIGGLTTLIREQLPDWNAARPCEISEVAYAGEEGGIICRLALGDADRPQIFFVSITHLTFERRSPLAREIASYQRRRDKRIKRLRARELLQSAGWA